MATEGWRHYALPPDVYMIAPKKGHGGKVIMCPAESASLYLDAPGHSTTLGEYSWQICGDGLITSIECGQHAYVYQPSMVTSHVTRSQEGVKWMINVKWNTNEHYYYGHIMTSDTNRRFWGVSDGKVTLQADNKFEWKFIPAYFLGLPGPHEGEDSGSQ